MTLATWILAAATVVLAGATIYYAVLTRHLLNEQSKSSRRMMMPSVLAILRPSATNRNLLELVVRNSGMGPALKVALSFSPPEAGTLRIGGYSVQSALLFRIPLPVLAAGEQLATDLIHKQQRGNVPRIAFTVKYEDSYGGTHQQDFEYDLALLCDLRHWA